MADIMMCQSITCKKRDYCYRHKAIPDKYQSYFIPDVSDPENGCKYFWDMRGVEIDETDLERGNRV